jgi:alcohol dehydrogenase
MRALVFHGPGDRGWDEVPGPKIDDDEDVIVQIDAVTICGTDLHILKGDVPEVAPGRVLGHEAVGTVVETGVGVRNRRVGDRVLVSCISACGRCPSCRRGQYGLCQGGGGWVLGHLIDGVQTELARVPFGDTSTYVVPKGLSDEQVLYLADILPTGYEVGVLNGKVQPGDVVAIVGAGPVGLAALVGAKLYSPGHALVVDPAVPRAKRRCNSGPTRWPIPTTPSGRSGA